MSTLNTHVMIGPIKYSILFQVSRIHSSFNLLLGSPSIHQASTIPSSLHQKLKFTHDEHIITIQSSRDVVTSSELVLNSSIFNPFFWLIFSIFIFDLIPNYGIFTNFVFFMF